MAEAPKSHVPELIFRPKDRGNQCIKWINKSLPACAENYFSSRGAHISHPFSPPLTKTSVYRGHYVCIFWGKIPEARGETRKLRVLLSRQSPISAFDSRRVTLALAFRNLQIPGIPRFCWGREGNFSSCHSPLSSVFSATESVGFLRRCTCPISSLIQPQQRQTLV